MAKVETIPRTIANQLTYNAHERRDRFLENELPMRAAVFEVLSPYLQQQLLSELTFEESVELLDALDLEKAKTVLAQLHDDRKRDKLIARLKSDLKDKADYFLRFNAKATLSLINFNYLLLASDTTVDQAATAMDAYYSETKKFPEILVHSSGLLIGEVPYATLIRASNKSKLEKLTVPVATIEYHADTTEAIDLLSNEMVSKVVVKDSDESIIGIVYTAEARQLMRAQPAASLYEFAGVAESEQPFDTVRNKVRHRYKWLIINLATAFLAGSVVAAYEDTLTAMVVLTMYLPIIAGMGGNASAQTLAVMVRGITMGEIRLQNCHVALKREIGAGLINGVINGLIVALVALLWNQSPLLGIVLFVSMTLSLVVAAVAGTVIPLTMKHFGKDPASSATIFITTITDVFGFFCFLALAGLLIL